MSRRAHLLTTASAQTPYPSPRRKRQVSSIPLCLLFPQSQRLCGSPFAAVVCLRHRALSEGDCGCCDSLQTMPQHLRMLLSSSAQTANSLRQAQRIGGRNSLPLLPPACANLPPATLTQIGCRLNRHPCREKGNANIPCETPQGTDCPHRRTDRRFRGTAFRKGASFAKI